MRHNISLTRPWPVLEVTARHKNYPAPRRNSRSAKRRLAPDPGAGKSLGVQLFRRAMAWCSPGGRALRAPGGAGCRGSNATRSTSWRTRARRHVVAGGRCPPLPRAGSHPRLPQLARQRGHRCPYRNADASFFCCRHRVRCSAVYGHPPARVANFGPASGATAHARFPVVPVQPAVA